MRSTTCPNCGCYWDTPQHYYACAAIAARLPPRPRLLDLFCGAGGASKGYHHAGFAVSGVDINDFPSYPFVNRLQADALGVAQRAGDETRVIHASPPCQGFTTLKHRTGKDYVDLLTPLRPLLQAWADRTGGVYIIENVPGAPLINPVQLCGSSFGLRVRRHRLFESNIPLVGTTCIHKSQGTPVGVYGTGGGGQMTRGYKARDIHEAREAMGIDWMNKKEIAQAIPPVYTEFIGKQVLRHLTKNCSENFRGSRND